MARILVVDDDLDTRESLSDWLAREHEVTVAADVPTALEMIDSNAPDVVVSDFEMPPYRGDQFLQAVAEAHPEIVRILHTGSPGRALGSSYAIAHRVFKKGCDMRELSDAIRELYGRRRRGRETS
jgi:DNA-binding NtrC family response regulator